MQDGLHLFQLPGGYYGRGVTMVGWLSRDRGDEWVLHAGARIIWRHSGRSVRTLGQLAGEGLKDDHGILDASSAPECVHRLMMRRSFFDVHPSYLELCPCPPSWRGARPVDKAPSAAEERVPPKPRGRRDERRAT